MSALTAFVHVILLIAIACGGGSDKASSQATPAAQGTPVAAGGHGLLLPRDQRLLLRDMTNGKEYVLKRAAADTFYTYPRWSPDGASIAYSLDVAYTGLPEQNWGSDLAIAPADGSAERIVLRRPNAGFKIEGLAWSPDGRSLFAGILDTTIKDGRFVSQTLRIERIDAATGSRQALIDNGSLPTVSPDGARLAYVSYGTADEQGGLWTAKTDGTDKRLILPLNGKFAAVTQPRFSPDGRSIAFAAVTVASGSEPPAPPRTAWRWPWQVRTAAAHGLPMDVWEIPAGGGEPRRITNMLEDEPSPAWSPDGGTLAIVATGGLYEVPAAGGDPRKIGLGGTQVQIDWR